MSNSAEKRERTDAKDIERAKELIDYYISEKIECAEDMDFIIGAISALQDMGFITIAEKWGYLGMAQVVAASWDNDDKETERTYEEWDEYLDQLDKDKKAAYDREYAKAVKE